MWRWHSALEMSIELIVTDYYFAKLMKNKYARRVPEQKIEIPLPVILTRDTIYSLVAELFRRLRERPKIVVLNFSKLEQIQVGGITFLCNIVELLRMMGIQVVFFAEDWCKANTFLQCSGLLTLYQPTKYPTRESDVFLPVRLVEYDKSHSYMHEELVPWLARILGHDPRALSSLRVCFDEIFNNIRDHSTIDVGCSAAHFDVSAGKITICISDFGIGIPGRVRRTMELGSDHAAIAMACQEGFTTQTTPGNRGAGLHILLRNVVGRNRGTVVISSGEGLFTCVPHAGFEPKGSGRPARGTYPGTMIYITFNKSDFVPSEIDGEEFQWE